MSTNYIRTPPVPGPSPLRAIVGNTGLASNTVRVYFGARGENFDNDVTGEGFNTYERARFQAAFDQIEAVANIDFRIVNNAKDADFRLVLDMNEMPSNTLGYFYSPGFGMESGTGVFNGDNFDRNGGGNLEAGGDGYATILHEVMHGLGLMHPHDKGAGSTVLWGVDSPFNDYGRADLNQGVYTAMSYNTGHQTGDAPTTRSFGSEAGPMALDIAALQLIYGASANAAGNTVYRLPDGNTVGTGWHAIWDTGGIDLLVYDGQADATLDLRAATLNYAAGGGGFVSSANGISGGYTIAKFTVIEQAYGGFGDDRIVGNGAGNVLLGRNGHDIVLGLNGHDVLNGGNGNDVVQGGAGHDRLFGQAGNDHLIGDSGPDVLHGGAGADHFVFRTITDSLAPGALRDTIRDFARGTDKINLSMMDADLSRPGHQDFDFIGRAGFGGDNSQGDVRVHHLSHGGVIVAVDQDGDGIGDMQIVVQGVQTLTESDFIL